MPLQVQVASDRREIFFRYLWPAERPQVYHDMLRFADGQWTRHGVSRAGPDPDDTYKTA